jgi:hypothetical protein
MRAEGGRRWWSCGDEGATHVARRDGWPDGDPPGWKGRHAGRGCFDPVRPFARECLTGLSMTIED